ncbi:hypothetical protein [Streptosporangium sp. NBC_01756]|uniref:hypothetical protein n=1 Tax=Streptosporangium sp. NBC_01756 TaxID=2975950 RepID=UPI002DDC24E4|nr:hypothetical protein [Streptosporangium sp. NBC_01756]WSC89326.1 hypothetical protein OIE48_14400 [Streptosporangium sp. NBC_01756]
MSRVLTAIPVAALALTVLAGCGTQNAASPQPSPPAADRKQDMTRQMEAMRADCMKRKGFKYNVNVPPPKQVSDEKRKLDSGDYETMKKSREKYGFKYFAEFVYPNDLAARRYEFFDNTANQPIKNALSAAQLEAWGGADETCRTESIKKFTGKTVTSEEDYFTQLNRRLDRADRETDSDPKLVELARAYGDCLKGKGYPVTSLRPTKMVDAGGVALLKELNTLGRNQAEDPIEGAEYQPKLTAEQARPYLTREIKAALDDLECGKDFYPAYRADDASKRAFDEFGYGVIQW